MGTVRYVYFNIDFIKNMPAKLLAELITLDEPIPEDFQFEILENNPSFRKERSEFIGRHDKILHETWKIKYEKKQILKESAEDFVEFECEEDLEFIKKYPQFKELISHIEFVNWNNGEKQILERIPIDQYLAEN